MSPRITDLPAAAWLPSAAGGYAASFVAACAGGIAIEAAGWPVPDAARLLPPDGPPVHFLAAGAGGFAAVLSAAAGARFALQAPQPPLRCRIATLPQPAASPSLALLAPRALLAPPRAPPRVPARGAAAAGARVAAALAAQDLDAALGAVAEMLAAARGRPETQAAIGAILAHLARHPFCRSPALGAFVAALME